VVGWARIVKDEKSKRKKLKETIQYMILSILSLLILSFVVLMNVKLEGAPFPWEDPLGFIWHIIAYPEPERGSVPWAFIYMIFLLPFLFWIVSLYEYFNGIYEVNKFSDLGEKVFLAWIAITILLIVTSLFAAPIVHWGLKDTLIVWGIILAIILISTLKDYLS
jgi:hypothetical protein